MKVHTNISLQLPFINDSANKEIEVKSRFDVKSKFSNPSKIVRDRNYIQKLNMMEVDKRMAMVEDLGAQHRQFFEVQADYDIVEFEKLTDRQFNSSADMRSISGSPESARNHYDKVKLNRHLRNARSQLNGHSKMKTMRMSEKFPKIKRSHNFNRSQLSGYLGIDRMNIIENC